VCSAPASALTARTTSVGSPGIVPAVRRHDAADGQLLHVLQLRLQHRLRIAK
jgi:hypothetical protein